MQVTTDVCGRMHMFMHHLLYVHDNVRVICNIVMEIVFRIACWHEKLALSEDTRN